MLKNEKVLRNVPKLILICIGDSDGNATPTGVELLLKHQFSYMRAHICKIKMIQTKSKSG
jgi:hypothetical protein